MSSLENIKSKLKEAIKLFELDAASEEDKIVILEVAIEELRRVHTWLDRAYARLKNRALAYLGGGLLTLVFLFSQSTDPLQAQLSHSFPPPPQVYGMIFYFAGFALVIVAIVFLLLALLPKHWEFSVEFDDIETLNFVSKKDYLEYVKKRYITAHRMNLEVYERSMRLLNYGFYPLIFGAIILGVLKIFGT